MAGGNPPTLFQSIKEAFDQNGQLVMLLIGNDQLELITDFAARLCLKLNTADNDVQSQASFDLLYNDLGF